MTKAELVTFSLGVFWAFSLIYAAAFMRSTADTTEDLENRVSDLEFQTDLLADDVDELEGTASRLQWER